MMVEYPRSIHQIGDTNTICTAWAIPAALLRSAVKGVPLERCQMDEIHYRLGQRGR